MQETIQERRLADRRGEGRRVEDIKLRLLEESLKELPRYFLAYSDPQKGVYSFFYSDLEDAESMMRALVDARVTTPVAALMSAPVGTVDARTPLAEATQRLRSTGVTGLVVVTGPEERPVGMFTQREALESTAHADHLPVDVMMSSRFITVHEITALHHAAAQAAATRARHVLVMEGKHLVGIVSGLDFAKAAAAAAAVGSHH